MPVPTNVSTGQGAPPTSERKPQKEMTKAERRELQERQRAAKLAQKSASGAQTGGSAQAAGQASAGTSKPSHPGAGPSKAKQTPPTPSEKKKFEANRPRSSSVRDPKALTDAENEERLVSRGLRIFHHFGLPKHIGYSIKGDIHPAIIRLGLLFSEFKICGSNARCIATLTAFKKVGCLSYPRETSSQQLNGQVIQDYTTPQHNTLSRHLMTHLSPQITYLVAARPMSVTMGNAIRQLKLEISNSDIDMVEQDASVFLI
jgi:translation initiation factor eIF-2B subunit delta